LHIQQLGIASFDKEHKLHCLHEDNLHVIITLSLISRSAQ